MTPTINVNLTPCPHGPNTSSTHWSTCPSKPVLIPLRLPPSANFKVHLGGECIDVVRQALLPNAKAQCGLSTHATHCSATPVVVSVSCSISGKTWADSFVDDIDPEGRNETTMTAIRDACDARWALVKALMLGHPAEDDDGRWTGSAAALFAERDAVFKALAEMARAEQAALRAQQACDEAFPYSRHARPDDNDHRKEAPSVGRLAAYLQHALEQVGTML